MPFGAAFFFWLSTFENMKAAILEQLETYPILKEVSEPEAGEGQVKVRVNYCALNRRDYWITRGQYPGIELPLILGSDVCGEANGRKVIINPGMKWGHDERVQSKDFHILGLPSQGGLAEYVIVPGENVYDKPPHLTDEEASALPLAGVTAYRALFTQGHLKPGQKVLVTGAGGGVASMAVQLALAHGAKVYVTSGTEEKREKARQLGVTEAFDYRSEALDKEVLKASGGIDLIIDGTAGHGVTTLMKTMNPGGRIVCYGGTLGKIPGVNPQLLFWRQLSLVGSTMGSPKDFKSMLDFVSKNEVRPIVDDVIDLQEVALGFKALEESSQHGKVVIRCTP